LSLQINKKKKITRAFYISKSRKKNVNTFIEDFVLYLFIKLNMQLH
jgi:hypothetical protein